MLPEKILSSKIFIVDDSLENVQLLTDLLKRRGFQNIHSVTESLKAVETYLEIQPDLVLLDLNMPHLDGFGVMEQLNALDDHSDVPVIVLTAKTDQEIRIRAFEAGVRDFISKPFNIKEVINRIQNWLEVRLLHKEISNQNRELEARVRERTQKLAHTQREIVKRLARAGEYRDNETGMHIVRMSRYSSLLAETVGINPEGCELIFHASPMHDIGKIGIPDRILLKPGKLTRDEWDIMRSHTEMGAEILSGSDSDLLKKAEVIAKTHHEKWDGSGYPKGTKGEDIPIEGRIVAVSDVFDALTSERPYKKAWTVEEAVEELDRGRGAHFDPQLIEKFKHVLPDVLKIKSKFVDSEETQSKMSLDVFHPDLKPEV